MEEVVGFEQCNVKLLQSYHSNPTSKRALTIRIHIAPLITELSYHHKLPENRLLIG